MAILRKLLFIIYKKGILLFLSFLALIVLSLIVLQFMPQAKIKNVSVSNVSSQSLTLSWTTDKDAETKVLISKDEKFPLIPLVANFKFDDRDKTLRQTQKRKTHYITFSNLTPNTHYKIRIYQGLIGIYDQKVTTGSSLTVFSPNPVYGKVLKSDRKSPAEGVIVYLRVAEASKSSALLSTLTNAEGRWSIDLSNARIRNLSKPFKISVKSTFERAVLDDGSGKRYKLIVKVGKDKPWPTIVLRSPEQADK